MSYSRHRNYSVLFMVLALALSGASAHAHPDPMIDYLLESTGFRNYLSGVDTHRRSVLPESAQWGKKSAASKYMNALDKAISAASSGSETYESLCSKLKTEPAFSEAYRNNFGFTTCYRPDWKTKTEDLFDTTCLTNWKPMECFDRRLESDRNLIKWLSKKDSPVPAYTDLIKEDAKQRCEADGQDCEKLYPGYFRHEMREGFYNAYEKISEGCDPSEKVKRIKRGVWLTNDPHLDEWLMKTAYSAVPMDQLPETVEGFDSKQVLEYLKSWTDGDLESVLYTADLGGGKAYVSVPALTALANEYKPELQHILKDQWVPMPMEKASLLALQEMSISSKTPIENFATATPKSVYVSRDQYVQFMNLYRANKMAFAGDDISGAIKEMQNGVSRDLAGLKDAVNRNADNTAALTNSIGPSLKSIKHAAWLSAIISGVSLLK